MRIDWTAVDVRDEQSLATRAFFGHARELGRHSAQRVSAPWLVFGQPRQQLAIAAAEPARSVRHQPARRACRRIAWARARHSPAHRAIAEFRRTGSPDRRRPASASLASPAARAACAAGRWPAAARTARRQDRPRTGRAAGGPRPRAREGRRTPPNSRPGSLRRSWLRASARRAARATGAQPRWPIRRRRPRAQPVGQQRPASLCLGRSHATRAERGGSGRRARFGGSTNARRACNVSFVTSPRHTSDHRASDDLGGEAASDARVEAREERRAVLLQVVNQPLLEIGRSRRIA